MFVFVFGEKRSAWRIVDFRVRDGHA